MILTEFCVSCNRYYDTSSVGALRAENGKVLDDFDAWIQHSHLSLLLAGIIDRNHSTNAYCGDIPTTNGALTLETTGF